MHTQATVAFNTHHVSIKTSIIAIHSHTWLQLTGAMFVSRVMLNNSNVVQYTLCSATL